MPAARRTLRGNALRPGGLLVIDDVLLHDDLGGPPEIANYSVVLFYLTKGRAYMLGNTGAG